VLASVGLTGQDVALLVTGWLAELSDAGVRAAAGAS
jgi:hypothetical protein